MGRVVKTLLLLLTLVQLTFGFGEEGKVQKLMASLSSHAQLVERWEGLLYWSRIYRIPFQLEGGEGVIQLKIVGSRLPFGKGKIEGEITQFRFHGRTYHNLAKIEGATADFKKYQFKISPFKLGRWEVGVGRGLMVVEGNKSEGVITFPRVVYKGDEVKITGKIITIQWSKGERFKPVTATGMVSLNRPQISVQVWGLEGVVADPLSSLSLLQPHFQFTIANSKLNKVGVLDLLGKGGRAQILHSPSTIRIEAEVREIKVADLNLGGANLKMTTSFNNGSHLWERILNREWDGIMVYLHMEGSKLLIDALKKSLPGAVASAILDNFQRRGSGYNLEIQLTKQGELSINGTSVLP